MDHITDDTAQGYRETLQQYRVDAVTMMSEAQAADKPILVEGANALMLDIDHGYAVFSSVICSNTNHAQDIPLCHQFINIDGRCHFRPRHQPSQDQGDNRGRQGLHHAVRSCQNLPPISEF